jgi:hypothetical protein
MHWLAVPDSHFDTWGWRQDKSDMALDILNSPCSSYQPWHLLKLGNGTAYRWYIKTSYKTCPLLCYRLGDVKFYDLAAGASDSMLCIDDSDSVSSWSGS